MSQNPVYVSLEFTPNPNTLKYAVNVELLSKGAKNFNVPAEAKNVSPLVEKIFETAGISGVMVGKDFITVTKSDDGDWDIVHKYTSGLITKWLTDGNPVFTAEALEALTGTNHSAGSGSELEQKIKDILDKEIRPAVAMDGGDISFDRFEDGVVFLQMKGSCAGCPSSTMTLKMGIETRLKKAVPEVREVVSV
ncbi:MAG: NifU family protein [Xanthomonadaceae bacterium]|nr:NifU family protein [Xanthomonadaceae bacterium]